MTQDTFAQDEFLTALEARDLPKDKFFAKLTDIALAVTYPEIRLRSGRRTTTVLPASVGIESKFSRRISLKAPIVAAAMEITEAELAIAMAQCGGIGIIFPDSPDRQASMVRIVKRELHGRNEPPACVKPDQTMGEVATWRKERKFKFHSFPVTNDDGVLIGLITRKDFQLCRQEPDRKVRDVMTSEVIHAPHDTDYRKALAIMKREGVTKLPLVDAENKVTGFYVWSDVERVLSGVDMHNVDANGRLRVAAAIGCGTAELEKRAALLVERGVDALVIDSAHADVADMIDTLKRAKSMFPDTDVLIGNISEPESAWRLAEAGADGIKVGQGPSSICKTRLVAGYGCPQATAVYECAKVLRKKYPDVAILADGGIGTTGRGIGPTYTDHVARIGLFVNDLLNPDVFVRKLRKNLREKLVFLRAYDPDVICHIMHHEHLEDGRFWSQKKLLDADAIIEAYLEYGKRLEEMVRDTETYIRDKRREGKRILLEGAQGNLLSVDIGTYPYVTSSDCSVRGLAHGVGLRERDVNLSLGIVKFPYMTRVGGGPFPTEIGGTDSAKWCARGEVNRILEAEKCSEASVNSPDPFLQGIGIRKAGGEYGSTTARPRRIGWLDLPFLRYSVAFTGTDAILTKPDVLDECGEIQICTEYRYWGPRYHWGGEVFEKGRRLAVAVPNSDLMTHCEPVYQTFPGWQENIRGIREYRALPTRLRELIEFVQRQAGLKVRAVSVGPDREQTIFVEGGEV